MRKSSGKQRAEFSVGDEQVAVVYDGDTYWSWSPSRGARTNAGRDNESHGLGSGPTLLDTVGLLSILRFSVLGQSQLLGRPAIEVAAEPRPTPQFFPKMVLSALGRGADDYRFLVDNERGVLLRSEARLGGRPFRVIETSEVAFDEELPAETFRIDLPDGEEFDATRENEMTSIEELPSLVPFTVFVPERDLRHAHVEVSRHRREDGRRVPSATIIYSVHSRPIWITEVADADNEPWESEEVWERRGALTIHEESAEDHVRCKIRLTRDGTAIHLESSGATLEELIAIAESLHRYPA
jgi:outer membrane lipoprotein-sorting protein